MIPPSTPLIVIRAQPGCDATVAAARKLGLNALGFPLFSIEPVAWDAPDPAGIDALLIGSANALRHGGADVARYAGKPAYAVGEVTADSARAAGLDVVATGRGGLQAVLDTVPPEHARLLRLAGQERLHLTPPQGVTICERVAYASRPQPMPAGLAALLAKRAVVALHSAEAARHFAAECRRLGVARTGIAIAALGPRVAEAAGDETEGSWHSVSIANTPDDGALLALAGDLCHSCDGAKPQETNQMPADPLATPLRASPGPRSARTTVVVGLLAVLVGSGLAGWLVWHGDLDAFLPGRTPAPATVLQAPAPAAVTASPVAAAATIATDVEAMESRVAILDRRLAQLGTEADAAAGKATRAESLLIVAATRRLVEKGAPLGAIGDQFKLRFGDGHPNAVRTVLDASQAPVTLDELTARLDALGPGLTDRPGRGNSWARVRSEVSNLFVIRKEAGRSADPTARLERARLMLAAGKVEGAIAEVERLPGADGAADWIAAARRYDRVQRALDLVETAAILMPIAKPALAGPTLPSQPET